VAAVPAAGPTAQNTNETRPAVVRLTAPAELSADVVGVKAFNLARLAAAGLPVPDGFVVTADALSGWDTAVRAVGAAAGDLGADRFAVRSSGVAEDLAGASFAGQYNTLLDVVLPDLPEAVRRVFGSAASDRIAAYQQVHAWPRPDGAGMAVLVQPMIAADAAGVAFTAHPVTGDRGQVVVTAVRGLGEALVSGEATGEEWVIADRTARRTRAAGEDVLDASQAEAVAALARRVEWYFGSPQDIEWAISAEQGVVLLQARPMTALPEPVSWIPPEDGWWMRNFRLGEWLPEPLTPLFADWLLPVLERGTAAALRHDLGVPVRTVSVIVNGWYYTSPPPRPAEEGFAWWLLRHPQVLLRIPAVVGFIVRPDLATAALDRRTGYWRVELLPRYRQAVTDAAATLASASASTALADVVDTIGGVAGEYLWSTWTVAGSQWKIEARLARFCHRHLPDLDVDTAVLTAGLPGTEPDLPAHAVHSLDWFWPTAGEADRPRPVFDATAVHADLAARRREAEDRCRVALAHRPRLWRRFARLLALAQRYAVVRELQTRALSLGWPVLRASVLRLGDHLVDRGTISQPADVFYCMRAEVDAALREQMDLRGAVATRRTAWQRQRRLTAPFQIGHPPRLAARVSGRMHGTPGAGAYDALAAGQGASPGRATGVVRVILDPADRDQFQPGDILVTRTTTPAWTPLLAVAAAVVTDIGTLAAHASLVAREFGIPAVVGTGDGTARLHDGQRVTVDGTAGTVTPT
jgi:pyruvate,water dikinase